MLGSCKMDRLATVAHTIVQQLDRMDLIETLLLLSKQEGSFSDESQVETELEPHEPPKENPIEQDRVQVSKTVEADFSAVEKRKWIVIDARLLRKNGFSVHDLKSLSVFTRHYKLLLFDPVHAGVLFARSHGGLLDMFDKIVPPVGWSKG